MKFRKARSRWTGAVLAACAVGVMTVGASPASAAMSDNYVRGYDTYVGDWGDEGPMAFGFQEHNDSNAVCLWQKVLWAEGAKESDLTTFDHSDVDGHFGPNTDAATRSLQARWGLTIDGEVGGGTFGRADNNLRYVTGSTGRGELLYLTYHGKDHDFAIRRDENGIYEFADRNGTRRNAGYDYNTCD
ncbi:MAG: Tat pathway signal protein [Saccharothrix sp.]|nr:Tat pathway signal protein [Saccharothrix sp.]